MGAGCRRCGRSPPPALVPPASNRRPCAFANHHGDLYLTSLHLQEPPSYRLEPRRRLHGLSGVRPPAARLPLPHPRCRWMPAASRACNLPHFAPDAGTFEPRHSPPFSQPADDPLSYMAVDSDGRIVFLTQVLVSPSAEAVNSVAPASDSRFQPAWPPLSVEAGPPSTALTSTSGAAVYTVRWCCGVLGCAHSLAAAPM